MMARIGSRDTEPERIVRRALHKRGYRFRLHGRDLPGTPDIVLPKYRTAIYVHGCFWHRHAGCQYATNPGTNRKFWEDKFAANVFSAGSAEIALIPGFKRAINIKCSPSRLASGLFFSVAKLFAIDS